MSAQWMQQDDGAWPHTRNEKCDRIGCKPVAVVPYEDREQVERLARSLHQPSVDAKISAEWDSQFPTWRQSQIDHMQAALREFDNPKPPKPDEPTGLGAVVEDAGGYRWVRDGQMRFWTREEREPVSPLQCEYADIDAVRVLSEGVTP